MRKTTLALLAGAAAIAASGSAVAQHRAAPQADFTRAAAQERADEAFQRMDANGDGQIDAADREARTKARFDRVDANLDGAISYDEYTAQRGQRNDRMGHRGMRGYAMGPRGLGRSTDAKITRAEFETALLARFDAADADNDGTVTAAERRAQGKQWREHRAQRAR